jgi:hypothetical protein
MPAAALTRYPAAVNSNTMEAPYSMHPVPMPGQPAYYFYNPEVDAHQRPHGPFVSPPAEMPSFHAPMPVYPPQQQPIFTAHPPLAPKSAFHPHMNMTPIASPRPTHLRPTIIVQHDSPALMPLDTRFVHADFYGFPSTPPLSSSGSTISSPPSSCGMLQTPVNGSFFPLEKVEGVKEGCESEVLAESLAYPDWSRAESPPLTPGEPFFLFLSRFVFPCLWSQLDSGAGSDTQGSTETKWWCFRLLGGTIAIWVGA